MSIVSNGCLKGKSLKEIINIYKDNLLGSSIYNSNSDFPLLIKIIDANDKLSVQVHPDDDYALKCNEKNGKNEVWYILDAKPGAKLIYGLKKSTTRYELLKAIENKEIKKYLNEIPVKPGDTLYIPAGTVHAILDGILIAEIQQDSDTTYRLYDWDRLDSHGNPRELHIKKALDVINFNEVPEKNNVNEIIKNGDFTLSKLCSNKYFTLEKIDINGTYVDTTDGSKFYIYFAIEGSGYMEFSDGHEEINPGDTLLIPASMGEYNIKGKINILKTYI